MIEIEFFGVRGSTPCSCDSTCGVGGNTSCVVLRCGDDDPIILDLGTGVRYLGQKICADQKSQGSEAVFNGTALVTHLHWDHVQGLPFFVPLLSADARLTIVGPAQERGTLRQAIESFVSPPLFPVDIHALPGSIDFIESSHDQLSFGDTSVLVRPVEHLGATNGYRIEYEAGSVAYIPDHQQPIDGSNDVSEAVLELCQGVDVLIHDAQYGADEFELKRDWGHSTVEYAVAVAHKAGVSRLVLFHHDPSHSDEWVAKATSYATGLAKGAFEVVAATEQLVIVSGSSA